MSMIRNDRAGDSGSVFRECSGSLPPTQWFGAAIRSCKDFYANPLPTTYGIKYGTSTYRSCRTNSWQRGSTPCVWGVARCTFQIQDESAAVSRRPLGGRQQPSTARQGLSKGATVRTHDEPHLPQLASPLD